MPQTAVEWLVQKLSKEWQFEERDLFLIEQAKEMGKQQIIEGYDQMRCVGNFDNGEQYYNQTFKKE